ncbi:hypothetical protein JDW19_12705 [Paenibacillus polymyxa]|jgi:hypothetical protein|uniref:Uncharacterized protein n=2 Tax=Paenibacillus polymyxa TaxID=1406 RepID=A0A8I1J1L6_PAEPO|nr:MULTISPECIES: hypothetical protein [Paenibacillus]KAF6568215.1 hypothetical protein G9G53_23570 [Paenibacillus sp. EKM206P]KAF6585285.1 hypothetical protein G9G52_23560 [Paenibacillus sp. EKM205P]KEO76371.1 hypothetical protein EL23_23525 [Paenibacillus polymyxa]MBM0633979.1 hypothetical protein [Paenibacillus polymyxa]MBP1312416.1 hypothetical protein [Paenibacillus sp. 1182]
MKNETYTLAAMLPDKPLQSVEPRLYRLLVQELEMLHLHPYDVKAGGRTDDHGITVYLRFGEELGQVTSRKFSWALVEDGDEEVLTFFKQSAEKIKKSMIADYFKMMKF